MKLTQLLHRISTRVTRLLERHGLLVRDRGHVFLDFEPGETFDLQAGASIRYRIDIGPNAGTKALTLAPCQRNQNPLRPPAF